MYSPFVILLFILVASINGTAKTTSNKPNNILLLVFIKNVLVVLCDILFLEFFKSLRQVLRFKPKHIHDAKNGG